MDTFDDFTRLGIERHGDILVVRIQQPGNDVEHTEFSRLFSRIRADDARVVVLTGTGDQFMPLADMNWYANVGEQEWLRLMREGKWLLRDLVDLPQPVIVGLNGAAVGLGASIASFADIIIASDRASFSDAHMGMGLVAGDGGTLTLPLSMGVHRAKAFYLMNRVLSATDLLEMGIAAEVVAHDELEARVMQVASAMARMPREALEWTKMTLNRTYQLSLLIGGEAALGHEGWSWHLEAAQRNHNQIKAMAAESLDMDGNRAEQ